MAVERRLTWQEVEATAASLCRRLAGDGPWHGVVAVARGGLVPAALVARGLGLRLVDTLCLASYDGRRRGQLDVVKIPESATTEGGEGWLVVDDLVDSGATARKVRQLLPRARIAVLYSKPDGRGMADVWGEEVAQGIWLVFPWETAKLER
ncbi:MAG: xanthine phosphoribosyltransferase [Magnetospirillum sp. WYHS-4]